MSAAPAVRPDLRLARVFLRAVGPLSDGLSLCFAEGLTSGRMVEYVYENRPRGRFGVGRWIDARFLAAPGWQAVRERRALLESQLEAVIRSRRESGATTVLVDIASGPAGYVLAVLSRTGETGVTARCRDLDERWLARGRERAAALGLRHVTFERGDALDRAALLALAPRPDLVVASGFYDWITDDATVQRSIARVAETLAPGGRFVLTHQTANPDLAFLNAVFTDFNHAPLTMKMRDVATVHGWLTAAGLPVETWQHDTRRYYAVTTARKP
jgi:SAM-dependent methyltransferase